MKVGGRKMAGKIRSVLRLCESRRTPEQPSPRTAHRRSYMIPLDLRMPLSCYAGGTTGLLAETANGSMVKVNVRKRTEVHGQVAKRMAKCA